MRQPGGLTEIEAAIDKLSRHHIRHIKAYDPNEGMSPYSVISKLFGIFAVFSILADLLCRFPLTMFSKKN
jgi:hypothetical protein